MPEVFAWSCAGPYEKILSRSCWHPLRFSKWSLHDLAQVLVRRSCGDRSGTRNVGRLRRRFKIGTAPQRERSDTHKVTRGFREHMLDFYKTLRAQRKMNNYIINQECFAYRSQPLFFWSRSTKYCAWDEKWSLGIRCAATAKRFSTMSKPKKYNERGPCRKILQMPCFRGASMKALLGCSYGSFPAAAKQSCTIPCGKLLWRSWWNPLRGPCMISFVQVLVRRSCGDPAGISLKSLTQQVLTSRYWRCSALVLVWKVFWDVHRKLLSILKVLGWRSFEILSMSWYEVLVWGPDA